jgi:RNA polymerase sigma-70 factor (ECF subfamily)
MRPDGSIACAYHGFMDEATLIERCRRRDRTAQRMLYEQHVERVYALAWRMLANEHDARDLTQDVFVRAFEAIAQFEGRSSIATWLYRMTVNFANMRRRRRGLEMNHDDRLRAEDARTDSGPTADRVDIEQTLSRLTDEHRTILVLKYQQGLDYAQIAEVLDLPAGTIASRLNRARREFRRVFEGKSAVKEEETAARVHPTISKG